MAQAPQPHELTHQPAHDSHPHGALLLGTGNAVAQDVLFAAVGFGDELDFDFLIDFLPVRRAREMFFMR